MSRVRTVPFQRLRTQPLAHGYRGVCTALLGLPLLTTLSLGCGSHKPDMWARLVKYFVFYLPAQASRTVSVAI